MSAARLLLVVTLGLAACNHADATARPLSPITLTDQRYKGLVFLVATVRKSGANFLITNDSTQPWFDVTLVLAGGAQEYRLQIDEVDAGRTVRAAAPQFVDANGVAFDALHAMPRTLIVSAEIGEGGPTGVYAVRL